MAHIYIYSPSGAVRNLAGFRRAIKRLQQRGHTVEIDPDALTTEQLKERHKAKFYCEFDATSSHWIGDSDGEQRVGLLRAFRKGW